MTHLPLVTGSANSTSPFTMAAPPGPPHTYLGIARAFLSGTQHLASLSAGNAISLAFLAAQASECGLKAFLSRNGDGTRLKALPFRHNLVALWSLASSEGLAVTASPPPWVVMLDHLHGFPYYLRYSTGVNGLVTPATHPMVVELGALIEQVATQV